MTAPIVEPFLAQHARASDLTAWWAVLTGAEPGDPDEPVSADRIPLASGGGVLRWTVRSEQGAPIAGAAELRPRPHLPGTGLLRLTVDPAHRRRGLGTALWDRVVHGAVEAGVDHIQAFVDASGPDESFVLARPGAHVIARLQQYEQDIGDRSVLRISRYLAERPPAGYRLVFWLGPAPDDLAPSFARVLDRLGDGPGAGPSPTARAGTVGDLRAWEADLLSSGRDMLATAAVLRDSGDAVAATVTTVPPIGHEAEQQDTAVEPEHRRRHLARWIKAEQTLRLRTLFPRLRTVSSTFDPANQPMGAVNLAVGYRLNGTRILVEAPTRPR